MKRDIFCSSPKPVLGFPLTYVMVSLVFSDLRWEKKLLVLIILVELLTMIILVELLTITVSVHKYYYLRKKYIYLYLFIYLFIYMLILIWRPSCTLQSNERLIRWQNLISIYTYTFKPGDKITKYFFCMVVNVLNIYIHWK
jgi:hypothetical protein